MRLKVKSIFLYVISVLFFASTAVAGSNVIEFKTILRKNTKTGKMEKVWTPGKHNVSAGQNVRINLVNTLDTPHGFEIPGHVKPIIVQPTGKGKPQTVHVRIKSPGEYKVRCHMHPAHVGAQLVVTKRNKSVL